MDKPHPNPSRQPGSGDGERVRAHSGRKRIGVYDRPARTALYRTFLIGMAFLVVIIAVVLIFFIGLA